LPRGLSCPRQLLLPYGHLSLLSPPSGLTLRCGRNYDNTTDGSDLFIEMYDLDKDPHQLHNLAKESSPALKAQLHEMAVKQFHCAGASCT
jgi:hypothetical protein